MRTGTFIPLAGQRTLPIRLELRETIGGASVSRKWAAPGGTPGSIPLSVLAPNYGLTTSTTQPDSARAGHVTIDSDSLTGTFHSDHHPFWREILDLNASHRAGKRRVAAARAEALRPRSLRELHQTGTNPSYDEANPER